MDHAEATAFVVDTDIEPLVLRVVESHLKDATYDDRLAPSWAHYICEDVMAGLATLHKPFKYMVNAVVLQNLGAGVHVSTSEYCDDVNDGSCVIKWPLDRHKDTGNCACIVTVFGSAFFT